MKLSIQSGMRQQPNQQPIKNRPMTNSQVKRPLCFSVRVTIGFLQFGQTHCAGDSLGINGTVT